MLLESLNHAPGKAGTISLNAEGIRAGAFLNRRQAGQSLCALFYFFRENQIAAFFTAAL